MLSATIAVPSETVLVAGENGTISAVVLEANGTISVVLEGPTLVVTARLLAAALLVDTTILSTSSVLRRFVDSFCNKTAEPSTDGTRAMAVETTLLFDLGAADLTAAVAMDSVFALGRTTIMLELGVETGAVVGSVKLRPDE